MHCSTALYKFTVAVNSSSACEGGRHTFMDGQTLGLVDWLSDQLSENGCIQLNCVAQLMKDPPQLIPPFHVEAPMLIKCVYVEASSGLSKICTLDSTMFIIKPLEVWRNSGTLLFC